MPYLGNGISKFTTADDLTVSGDADIDGTTNLDIVDIDGAVDMASTLTVTGNVLVGTTTEGISDYGDTLTIADTDHAGMTIRSGTSSEGNVYFSDGTSGDAEYKGIVKYDHSSNAMSFWSNSLRRVTIDSSGSVGINAVPSAWSADNGVIQVGNSSVANFSNGAYFTANSYYDGSNNRYIASDEASRYYQASGIHIWQTAAAGTAGDAISFSEKMRLDSGNLLVGKTSSDVGTAGSEVTPTYISATRASNSPLFLNRTSSDGSIITFRKDNSAVGNINTGSNLLAIESTGNSTGLLFGTDNIFPRRNLALSDATNNLGSASYRFQTGFFSAGIQARYHYSGGDTDTYIDFATGNLIKFFTGGGERLRINDSGHVNIGQTSTNIPGQGNSTAGTSLRGVGDAYFSRDGDLALNVNRNGSDGKVVSFRRGGTEGGSISVTTTSATLASSSDARLKSNIEDAASASDKIDAIQVRQFDWNETGNHQDYGLIAQELQPIEPLAVIGNPDSDEMMGIDNSKLVPMLIKEIQQLRSRVAALEE
tara:strand:- start:281 stop:1891 length:1611 start_codon:yes stop_codon:yes gene_type:complete